MINDIEYMNEALKCAQIAADKDEVPIGAVVVNAEGKIIGRGSNRVECAKSQLAHAEIEAIRQATKEVGDWRLDGCTLYVTLEPCKMCMGLIQLSRINRVVYGARSARFGQGDQSTAIYKEVAIEKGVAAEQARELLQTFFQKKRSTK